MTIESFLYDRRQQTFPDTLSSQWWGPIRRKTKEKWVSLCPWILVLEKTFFSYFERRKKEKSLLGKSDDVMQTKCNFNLKASLRVFWNLSHAIKVEFMHMRVCVCVCVYVIKFHLALFLLRSPQLPAALMERLRHILVAPNLIQSPLFQWSQLHQVAYKSGLQRWYRMNYKFYSFISYSVSRTWGVSLNYSTPLTLNNGPKMFMKMWNMKWIETTTKYNKNIGK